MDNANASNIARRIGELWPSLNAEQIREVCKALKRDDIDGVRATNVVGEMYLEDSNFFKLDEFVRRARESVAVDPMTQPNSIEAQAAKRAQQNQEWQEGAVSQADLRKFVESLPAEHLNNLKSQFLELISERERVFYAARMAERLPTRFIVWAGQLMDCAGT